MNRFLFSTYLLFTFLLLSTFSAKAINDGSRYAKNSILSSGKWIQLRVKENAVYKLTYEDIKRMGFSDPSKIKIYGYGGWMLDEDFSKPYIDDLPEVSVWMKKNTNGVFSVGDYLLFYGRGVVKWTCNNNNEFEHQNNPYSTYGSYFITENAAGPKIMEELASPSVSGVNVTTFDDYVIHEKNESSIIASGKELFGESFLGKNSQNFMLSIPGITSDLGSVRVSFAGSPSKNAPSMLTLSIDGEECLRFSITHPLDEYHKATWVNQAAKWSGEKKEQTLVNISYDASGQTYAYLDYIRLNMKRRLQFYNTGFTFFRNVSSKTSDVKYVIENANTQSLVWDITDNFDTKVVKTDRNENKLSFDAKKNGNLREYVMIDYSKSFPTPEVKGEIKNQNLHATPFVDMVIIVPEVYARQAELLAERHSASGLKTLVVQPEWIYNEFSSGNPDATAYRRFMKMFYDRATTENEKPKYLLLFGDGIFDNRHLTKEAAKLDPRFYLLTFQVLDSTNEVYSYGTDDYFGFLDDNEGINLSKDDLDIGIGRFPVNTLAQAESALQKQFAYMDNQFNSEWKNRLIFTADDADKITDPYHMVQSNNLANYIEENHPQYILVKSYMDAYTPVSTNGKKTYPDAKKKFLNALKEGCFLLNYTGHGGTLAWSGEDMLNIMDVRQMNFEGLPLWITATCDFGWFDAINPSGGEEAFLNKKGGAIALYTTSRVVYSSDNYYLNDQLVRNLFSYKNNERPRLGDVLRESKKKLGRNSNKLNYVLLGDPALRLNYPHFNVELEKINGEVINSETTYHLHALDRVTLEGNITDPAGNRITDFNGKIKTTVFDSRQMITTRGQTSDTTFYSYSDYPNRVFIGNNQVENGKFSITFTVPLDISYGKDNGKINFFAYDETNGWDANGFYTKYILAGSSSATYGDIAPEIRKIFLNTESFTDGDNTNETPLLVARVFDELGINTTGNGLGHEISVCIDNSSKKIYPLNEYFNIINENEGEIRFSIPELTPGNHTLTFKIWNILNHSTIDSLHFNVVKGLKPNLFDIAATNIPARDFTYFRLTHDRPESIIEVEIIVYDLTGHPIWKHKETGSSSWMKEYEVEWDLTTNNGRKVEQGVYIYQAIINSPEGREATKAKKIVVVKQ